MSILTSDQKVAILNAMTRLGVSASTPFDAANALNAPTQTASGTAPPVPAPFVWQDMRGVLSLASRANLVGMGPSFTRILDLIDGMERAKLLGWIVDLLSFSKITSTESTSLNAILDATVPDPNWPPVVFGPSAFDTLVKASPIVIANIPYHFCTEQIITEARI